MLKARLPFLLPGLSGEVGACGRLCSVALNVQLLPLQFLQSFMQSSPLQTWADQGRDRECSCELAVWGCLHVLLHFFLLRPGQ